MRPTVYQIQAGVARWRMEQRISALRILCCSKQSKVLTRVIMLLDSAAKVALRQTGGPPICPCIG